MASPEYRSEGICEHKLQTLAAPLALGDDGLNFRRLELPGYR